ncbi:hypothetical protein STEG23_005897 [Scotinomys teguina]
MEPHCWAGVRGQGTQGPRGPEVSRIHTGTFLLLLLLLLLLLPRWPADHRSTDHRFTDHHLTDCGGRCGVEIQKSPLWPQFQSLQQKEVSILNSRKCEHYYHKFSRISSLVRIITPQMICVSDNNREKFCYELTGEPLVCSSGSTWYLVGMMSWDPGCKKSEAPPIFLQVSSYQAWIWDHLSGEALALPAPSRILLLAFLLLLSLLGTL